MALELYLDGSGDSKRSKYLTLAGVSATAKTWELVEAAWLDITGPTRFHASDSGWPKSEPQFNRLSQVIANYRYNAARDLRAFSCTVDMGAYRGLAQTICPDLVEAESICVDWCVGVNFYRSPTPSRDYLKLIFDRKERFRNKIQRMWERTGRREPHWAKFIFSIEAVRLDDDKRLLPLELPDLIGWVTNRHYAEPGDALARGLWDRVIVEANANHLFYGEAELVAEYNRPEGTIRFLPGHNKRNP